MSREPKKLALLRILQLLQKKSLTVLMRFSEEVFQKSVLKVRKKI